MMADVKATYEIRGYGIVLPKVQNYYPVEETETGWAFGLKYDSGVFEFFDFKTESEAAEIRRRFIEALNEAITGKL